MWGAPKQRKTGVKTLSPLEQVSPEYIIRVLGSIITTSNKLYRQLYVQAFLHLQRMTVSNLVSVLVDFQNRTSSVGLYYFQSVIIRFSFFNESKETNLRVIYSKLYFLKPLWKNTSASPLFWSLQFSFKYMRSRFSCKGWYINPWI